MERTEFDKMITEGFEKLPEWVRLKIKNVAILVENEPSQAERKELNLAGDETLLGLYKGIPLSARGEYYGVGMTLPDTITLYKLPLLEEAREKSIDIRDVIAETIWHEFAHHFGMNERQVQSREHERFPHRDDKRES